jgi:hypothetical protein
MWQVFERIMNAVTFAEAGEPETALSLLHGEGKESKSADNAGRKRVGISERAQQYMSAVTFAEEGEHQYAREALEEITPAARPAEAKCILVLGNEDTFADYLITYAVDMAERFDYEIIALNALPMSKKTRLLSGFADEIGERFHENARTAGDTFRRRAEERGVRFRQEIMLMSEQKAIRHLHKEKGNIEFVLTEPENLSAEQAPDCEGSVCVCSLV